MVSDSTRELYKKKIDAATGTGGGESVMDGVAKAITEHKDDADAHHTPATGDVTTAIALTDNAIVRGDGGAKGVQTSLVTISDTGALTTPTEIYAVTYRSQSSSASMFAYPNMSFKAWNGSAYIEVAALVGDVLVPYLRGTLPIVFLPIATASLPATPVEGMGTYDGTLNRWVMYNGASWDRYALFSEVFALVADIIKASHIDWGAGADQVDADDVPESATKKWAGETGANLYVHPNHSGEVTSAADGAQTIATAAVTLAKMADMATASLIYRKTAAVGVPEVNTLATLKTDLGLTGTNSGDNPGVTAVTGTSPVASSGGATPAISMAAATAASAGHATAAQITKLDGIADGATVYADADAVAAVAAAGVTFAENKGITLDSVLSADGKWCAAKQITGTAGAALAFGDVVYLAVADSKWELTDASAAATAVGLIGIVVVAAAENATATILLEGTIRADAAFPALTIGAPVHMSETAGDVVVAAPITASAIVRILGYGLTADSMYFCPDNTYLELA